MKVGIITSVPLVPPWDQGDKNLAYALSQAMPEITFSVLTAIQEVEPSGVNLIRLPLFRNRTPSYSQKFRIFLWYLKKSLNGMRENDIDLYHMNYQPYGLSSMLMKWLPEFRRIPSIHTVPATATSHQLSSSIFFAKRIVALTHFGKQKLMDLGIRNVIQIPVGIDIQAWQGSPDNIAHSKSTLGVSGKQVLLFPGHYRSAYGIDTLLASMPEISEVFPDVHYIFACRMRSDEDWAREKQVQTMVESMGMSHAVMFLHTVDDMKSVILASDVVLMPFKTMQDKIDLPTTLLEAMASGKPLVISDIPPMNELIHIDGSQAGEANVGIAHEPGNVGDLTKAIIKILSDDTLRSAMSYNGMNLVSQKFDILKVADLYREQYKELLA